MGIRLPPKAQLAFRGVLPHLCFARCIYKHQTLLILLIASLLPRSDAREVSLSTLKVQDMVNYDLAKDKKWREFIEGIRYGEVAQFTVNSTGEIDNLRTVAGRINTSNGLDYVYSVEANKETLRVQVYTKPRLN